MKKLLLLLLWSGSALLCAGQNIPAPTTLPLANPVTLPAAYADTPVNYIRVWEPSMPAATDAAVTGAASISQVRQSVEYYDGLGRLLQTVSKGISPGGRDMVMPVTYDALGRRQYIYLPYAQQSGNTSDGKFKSDPFTAQQTFYKNTALHPGIAGETIFYSQQEFEPSPLNRLSKSFAPGRSWAKEGGNKPVSSQYQLNSTSDDVRIWTVPANGIPVSTAAYAAGELSKQVTLDEHNIRSVVFTDKQGRALLKKSELSAGAADGHPGWLSTYYVYDDFNRLRYVIPPLAVDTIRTTWVIDAAVAAELCFAYRYDALGRMIVKKLPGADSVEMVYDVRDRQVFSRDGNRAQQNTWLATFYDSLNRVVATAIYNSNASRGSLQSSMNSVTSGTFIVNGAVTATLPLPGLSAGSLTPLTLNYYHNYSFAGVQSALTTDFAKPQAGTNPYAEANTAYTTKTTGLLTGSSVRVLNTSTWLTTTHYYNEKGRLIQSVNDNLAGGKNTVTTLYDFSGKVLSTYQRHTNPRSSLTPQTTILTTLAYDPASRVTSIKKKINDLNSLERTIATHQYYESGQLKLKQLGIRNAGAPLEQLSYEYNIRGWLSGINKAYVNSTSSTNWFGQVLSYDSGFTARQYNGNISGIKWKSKGNNITRAYGYRYDNTNRLLSADFTQQNIAGAAWTRNTVDFSVSGLDYDANGNIRSMSQKGMNGAVITTIDSLLYSYYPKSNKPFLITDRKNNLASTLGDFTELNGAQDQDYTYDRNGNCVVDMNKLSSVRRYNYLNLPDSIMIIGKGYFEFTYDANGSKWRKKITDVTSTGKITTIDYLDGLVYINDTLQLIAHEEGRIRTIYKSAKPPAYAFDYFLKDHLGSTRAVLTDQTDFTVYMASMEPDQSAVENALFNNVDQTRVPLPPGYPVDNSTKKNTSVAKLNAAGSSKKTGPSIVLRVMAGDTVSIGTKAYYKSVTTPEGKPGAVSAENIFPDILQVLAGSTPSSNAHGNSPATGSSPFTDHFSLRDYQQLKQKKPDQADATRPKAYLNFVLFDDQFNLVKAGSGVKQVKSLPDQLQTLAQEKYPNPQSGFLYVFTTNESPQDVLFDNISVLDISGPLLEETHYYPFGLTMAGISSNALKGTNYPVNKNKFNGIELNSDLDLYSYEAHYRNLDPQLGRWWQIDPKPNDAISPYTAMNNNPIRYSDFWGDTTIKGAGFWRNAWEGIKDGGRSTGQWVKSLGTAEGWGQTLDGIAAFSPFNVDEGAIGARAQMIDNAVNYAADIPNKTSDQIGHDVGYGVEKVGEAVVASKGVSLVKGGIGILNSTTLYRSVSGAELTSIAEKGGLSMGVGSYETGKLFAIAASDAAQFGKANFAFDQIPNTIIKVRVPNAVMKTVTMFEADGMPAVSIPANQLPKINFIKPLNFSPRPTNPFNSSGW
ncbi:DUF6443 domain-containing protein [Chitinophaga solisilvae]|uniref:DUF6443 domain-containing protein n=1 Tax=Chitinophaga solisilvae TaxID=1233460 RepID=UPI00136AA75A|nr:DUF6443 domain-containing protein [Chitinophaga solisilvae]